MALTWSHDPAPANARVSVHLPELIALRQRAAHASTRLPLRASRQAGSRSSHRRGRGMDYLESRAYQPGDDVRHLDWRLTARSGRLHTKIFEEESDHRVGLLIDTRASMRFGTRERFKSVQAARAVALMAWQVARAGGQVGALAFGGGRQHQGPRAGRNGALAVCAALARWDAETETDRDAEPLSAALRRMHPLLGRPGHVVLVSDGHGCDSAAATWLARWRRHMRVSVLVVADALEAERPPAGRYPLDCDGHRVVVDLEGARERARFHRVMGAAAVRLEETCRSVAVPCERIDTRQDPLPATTALLGLTRRRRA